MTKISIQKICSYDVVALSSQDFVENNSLREVN
jgi:hypothetical protein